MTSARGLKHWSRAVMFYGGAAYAATAAKDMLAGRTPRGNSLENFSLILANSGVGGIPLSLMAQLGYKTFGQNYYSSSPLGGIITDVMKASKGIDSPYRITKTLQNLSGVGRIWYARGAIDYVMRQAFLDEHEQISMNSWYEKNLKSSFFDIEDY